MDYSAVFAIFILHFLSEHSLAELGKFILFHPAPPESCVQTELYFFHCSMSRDCKEGTPGGITVKLDWLGTSV